MFTVIDENNPMIALRPVKAEYAVFMYVLVNFTGPLTRGPPPLVTMTAHRKSAKNVGGTMMPFTRNRTVDVHQQAFYEIETKKTKLKRVILLSF